jgi:hypothetical protein
VKDHDIREIIYREGTHAAEALVVKLPFMPDVRQLAQAKNAREESVVKTIRDFFACLVKEVGIGRIDVVVVRVA